jgi:rubrerythrin
MSLMHTDNAGLVAQLNDLLQLDYDAIAAYRVTLAELDSPALRAELQRNLDDHERHITELGEHIDQLGGMKMPLPHITGAFKLAVQAAVAMGSDRSVLLAFKANELQSRDKYARAAEQNFPQHIAMTVRRAAADERRHYDWAVRALVALGAERGDADVTAARTFSRLHGRVADTIESAERGAMHAAERVRRSLGSEPWRYVGAGLALVGAGAVLKYVFSRR